MSSTRFNIGTAEEATAWLVLGLLITSAVAAFVTVPFFVLAGGMDIDRPEGPLDLFWRRNAAFAVGVPGVGVPIDHAGFVS